MALWLTLAALVLSGLGAAAVAGATHKHTTHLWHHGLGDCCDGDGFLHPFMSEVAGTYRNSYVAWGNCCGDPGGYWHSSPEQFDDDTHNHIDIGTQLPERWYFASVRSPVTGLDHHHHTCGNGDCTSASSSENE